MNARLLAAASRVICDGRRALVMRHGQVYVIARYSLPRLGEERLPRIAEPITEAEAAEFLAGTRES